VVSLILRTRQIPAASAVALILAVVAIAAAGRAAPRDAIAFSTRNGVYAVDPAGRPIVPISRQRLDDVAWSPDRSAIAGIDVGLLVIRLDGGQREVPRTGMAVTLNPSWSPDGKKLAFSMIDPVRCNRLRLNKCPSEIYIVNADGSGLRRITDGRDAANGHFAPSWSPDGRRIAYSAYEGWAAGMPVRLRKQSRIMIVGASGGKSRLVLKLPFPYHADDLDWSWANGRIAFSYMHGSGVHRSNPVIASKIAVVRPDGRGLRDLTSFRAGKADDPAWSPDGRRIAFIGHLAGDRLYSWSAYVLEPGGRPRKLVAATSLDW
jgi:Tol biopolymer transport system component